MILPTATIAAPAHRLGAVNQAVTRAAHRAVNRAVNCAHRAVNPAVNPAVKAAPCCAARQCEVVEGGRQVPRWRTMTRWRHPVALKAARGDRGKSSDVKRRRLAVNRRRLAVNRRRSGVKRPRRVVKRLRRRLPTPSRPPRRAAVKDCPAVNGPPAVKDPAAVRNPAVVNGCRRIGRPVSSPPRRYLRTWASRWRALHRGGGCGRPRRRPRALLPPPLPSAESRGPSRAGWGKQNRPRVGWGKQNRPTAGMGKQTRPRL
eukprot:scaffold6655_cov87-Isochrysis_galbana.AAC.1